MNLHSFGEIKSFSCPIPFLQSLLSALRILVKKQMQQVNAIMDFLKDKRVWWEYHNNSFLGENGFWDLHFPQEWKDPLLTLDQMDLLDLASFGTESKVFNVNFKN